MRSEIQSEGNNVKDVQIGIFKSALMQLHQTILIPTTEADTVVNLGKPLGQQNGTSIYMTCQSIFEESTTFTSHFEMTIVLLAPIPESSGFLAFLYFLRLCYWPLKIYVSPCFM